MPLLQGFAGVRQMFCGCKIILVYKVKFETLNPQSLSCFKSTPLINEVSEDGFSRLNFLLWKNQG